MLQAVFFDFDGTLANTEKLAIYATQQAFVAHGLPKPDAGAISHYQGVPIETSFMLLGADVLSVEALEALYETFREYYRRGESAETIQLFPGIQTLLADLHAQQIAVFLMTSKKSAVAQRNLALLGVDHYFTAIYGSDNSVAFKPDPAGLIAALAEQNLTAAQTAMVGDATFDIQAGNGAGMQTIAVTWGSHDVPTLQEAQPTHIAHDVTELRNFLQR
jgi:HAD superfamily hydrolase (TIGR01509 family)